MNPSKNDITEKYSQGFRQLLVQFDDRRLLQDLLQFDRMARIESAGGRPEDKRFQYARATVLPEHATAAKLQFVEFLAGVEEVGPFVWYTVVYAKLVELFVEHINENIGHTRTGDV